MADTLREKVLADIKTTLEAVTVANGFNVDLKQVTRDKISPLDLDIFPAAIVLDAGESVERQGSQVDFIELSVLIELWISVELNHATTMNQLIGDVRKKMNEDPRRGTNATNTMWNGSESVFAVSEQPLRGEQLTYLIHYRSSFGDPFTQI